MRLQVKFHQWIMILIIYFEQHTFQFQWLGKLQLRCLRGRLSYNLHNSNLQYKDRYKAAYLAQQSNTPWYGNLVQICTALAAKSKKEQSTQTEYSPVPFLILNKVFLFLILLLYVLNLGLPQSLLNFCLLISISRQEALEVPQKALKERYHK